MAAPATGRADCTEEAEIRARLQTPAVVRAGNSQLKRQPDIPEVHTGLRRRNVHHAG